MECKSCKKSFENWSSLIQHEDECETPIERDSKPQSKFERLYKNKLRDCRRISRESQKKIKFLNDQLKELKLEFNNPKFNAFSILKCVAVSFWNLFLDAIITYRDNRSTIELDSYMLQGKSNALLHYLNFLGWYM